MKELLAKQIENSGVVAILRGITTEQLMPTAEALYAGGIRCVEVTLNTPAALDMIRQLRATYADKMLIGAGTVLDAESAEQAIEAGAQFVLAPTLDVATIKVCNEKDLPCIPGVFSPTEALVAWNAGAPIVKVFPCGSVGPQYIKDLRGPLPQIKMMAVGGVSESTAEAFFKAGACAIGTGSSLFSPEVAARGDYAEITRRAKVFTSIAR